MELPREHVQIMFDALVHSMDFGSGFLHEEEVVALRETAIALGLDAEVATPIEFRDKFNCPLNETEESRLRGFIEAVTNPSRYNPRDPALMKAEIERLQRRPKRVS
jgi:hypothetical protein